MAPNYVIPTNLILEMVILSGHSYGLGNPMDGWRRGIDEMCAGFISLFLVLNVVWMIYLRSKGREFTLKCLAARAFQGGVMVVLGVLLIVVAMSIRNEHDCVEPSCDKFETRIVIAVLVLVDSIFYFFNPLRPTIPRQVTTVLPPPGGYPHGEHGGNQLYYIEPPPSYFQIHNSNGATTMPPSYLPPPPPYGSVVSNISGNDSSTPTINSSVEFTYHSDDNNNIISTTRPLPQA